MKTSWVVLLVMLVVVYLIWLLSMTTLFMTETKCKEYIIEHQDEIIKGRDDYTWRENGVNIPGKHFKIDSCTISYYTDITLTIEDDSTYRFIFWGDRKSYQWRLKGDKHLIIDIPYERNKGEDVELDIKILDIINNK